MNIGNAVILHIGNLVDTLGRGCIRPTFPRRASTSESDRLAYHRAFLMGQPVEHESSIKQRIPTDSKPPLNTPEDLNSPDLARIESIKSHGDSLGGSNFAHHSAHTAQGNAAENAVEFKAIQLADNEFGPFSSIFNKYATQLMNSTDKKEVSLNLAVLRHLVCQKLAEGIYGPGKNITVEIAGSIKRVNAFDLLVFYSKLKEKKLNSMVSNSQDLIPAGRVSASTSRGTSSSSSSSSSSSRGRENELLKLWEQYSHVDGNFDLFRQECHELCGAEKQGDIGRSLKQYDLKDMAWTDQKKVMAYRVLRALPKSYSQEVKGVPISTISSGMYYVLLRQAVRNDDIFAALKNDIDKYLSLLPESLLKNVYRNPSIAHAYLSPQQLAAKGTGGQSKIERDMHLIGEIKDTQMLINTHKFTSRKFLKDNRISELFNLLEVAKDFQRDNREGVEFKRGDNRHAVDDIFCPKENVISIRTPSGQLPIHANRINLGGDAAYRVIAAQHPNATVSGLRNFYQMLLQEADVVLDLRKSKDFEGGRYEYMPFPEAEKVVSGMVVSHQGEMAINNQRSVNIKIENGANTKTIAVIRPSEDQRDKPMDAQWLRQMRKVALDQLQQQKQLLIHCSSGVNRTGVLLVYASLYQKLVGSQERHAINLPTLLSHVLDTVVTMRAQRGPDVVQNKHQLGLIINTIYEDLKKEKLINSHTNGDKVSLNMPLVSEALTATPVDTSLDAALANRLSHRSASSSSDGVRSY